MATLVALVPNAKAAGVVDAALVPLLETVVAPKLNREVDGAALAVD